MKKLHKTGIAIISALAPACALGITAGVVVANLPKQAVEEIDLEAYSKGGYIKKGVSIKKGTQYNVIFDYTAGVCSLNYFGFLVMDAQQTTSYGDKIESISGKDGTGEMTFELMGNVYIVAFHDKDQSQKITINVTFKEDIEDVTLFIQSGQ